MRERQLDDLAVEFPRIDDRLAGSRARYSVSVGDASLVRHDLDTGAAVEHRFGHVNRLPTTIEWLTDNGSCYLAGETRRFARHIGLEPLIKHNIPALTRHRLSWVKQNYLRAETLVSANARLSDV